MTDQPRDTRLRVRPYALTGGRVRSSTELALETIVRVTAQGEAVADDIISEGRDILRLCATPTSIAEVSAHLSLPLGVARVLVGDLVTDGFLDSHVNPASESEGSRPDLRLLERVLDGLQAL
ncbi:MAG: DUF742 domain-containing protein [Acidimicrobiales bacterium]